MQITTTNIELLIDGFPCRTYIAAPKPAQPGSQYPGILLYSEIFQLTGPICRTANRLAGHGFVVAAPEIYHRTCPPGLVIAYDDPGRMHGSHLPPYLELPGEHAFMRDEGARYDAEMTDRVFAEAIALYRRTLGWTE